jgi:hypothetical protein
MMNELPIHLTTLILTSLLTVCIYFIKKILDKFDKVTADVQNLTQQIAVMSTKFDLELKMVRMQMKLEEEKES